MNIRSTFVLGCAMAFVVNSAAMGASTPKVNALPPFVHYVPPVIQQPPVIVPHLPNITVIGPPRIAFPGQSTLGAPPVGILPPVAVNQPPLAVNQPPFAINQLVRRP